MASTPRNHRPGPILFACLFAAQAAFLAPAPVLTDIAHEFAVSTSTAGQLRTISGVAGFAAAVAAGRLAGRGVGRLLITGLLLLAVGAAASAASPSFAVLAAAQPALGAGISVVMAAGFTAASDWAATEQRSTTLAWAILGQPAAWVAAVPLIGLFAGVSWRWAWVVGPLAASLLALIAVLRHRPAATAARAGNATEPSSRPVGAALWVAGELLAYTGWSMILLYAGTLFVESYGVSANAVGWLLGGAAAGYLPGPLLARRAVDRHAPGMRVGFALAASGGVVVLTHARVAPAVSALALFGLNAVIGARTMAGNSYGLHAGPALRASLMSSRAAAIQFGGLAGAAGRGAALALGSYDALGVASAACLPLSPAAHALPAQTLTVQAAPRPAVAANANPT